MTLLLSAALQQFYILVDNNNYDNVSPTHQPHTSSGGKSSTVPRTLEKDHTSPINSLGATAIYICVAFLQVSGEWNVTMKPMASLISLLANGIFE